MAVDAYSATLLGVFLSAHPALVGTAVVLAASAWALWRRPVPRPTQAGRPLEVRRGRRRGLALATGLAALTVLALAQRWPGVAPPWLWLDDQWVRALVQHASVRELLELAPPAPIGFVLLLRAVDTVVGPGTGAMQLLPLAAGVAVIPLAGWIASRLTASVPLGLFAAALLAGSRTLGVYSLRVKQFTLEGLVALLLVALAARCVRRPGARTYLVVVAAAVGSLAVSFTALPVGLVIVNGLLLLALRSRDDAWRVARRAVVTGAVLYHVAALASFLVFRAGPANTPIVAFWHDYYLPVHDATAAWRFLATRGADFVTGALPPTLGWLGAGVPVAIVVLLLRGSTRVLGLAVLAFYAGLLAASALHLYPIGGRRTDVFAYPLTVLVITAAVWGLARWRRLRLLPWVALAVVVIDLLLFAPRPGLTYPRQGGRDVVELAAGAIGPDDALIVAPFANWAVGCYGPWPVRLAPAAGSTNGFRVEPVRERTLVLHEALDGVYFRDDAAVVVRQVEAFLATAAPSRIVLVTIGTGPRVDEALAATVAARGYEARTTTLPSRARLVRYERVASP